jgi:hypothetical protein
MAEDRDTKKDELKKQHALVNVNIQNAINQLNNGKVVSPGAIEEMCSQRTWRDGDELVDLFSGGCGASSILSS